MEKEIIVNSKKDDSEMLETLSGITGINNVK